MKRYLQIIFSMSISLVHWKPVIYCFIDKCDDICYICKRRFVDTCTRATCDTNCGILIPTCKHGYHKHCLPENTTTCYVCNCDFNFIDVNNYEC